MKLFGKIIFATVLIGLLISGSPLYGTIVSGVVFDKQLRTNQFTLDLRGAGVLRYMVFIKAYAGALYLPQGVGNDQILSDVPKSLEVEYFHPIDGEDFGPATIKGMAQNVGAETVDALRDRIEYHNSLYEDIQPGDRYSLTYIPGTGTILALNGEPKGTIEGADFAAALFSIWLGPEPIDPKFKLALLGI